jgi:hypothetical protein
LIQKRAKREFVLAFERRGRLSALHKRRKNKEKNANGSRSSAGDDQEQSRNPNLNPQKEKREERTSGESESKPSNEPPNPASSLATALPSGALARSPSSRASPSLEEIVRAKGWVKTKAGLTDPTISDVPRKTP